MNLCLPAQSITLLANPRPIQFLERIWQFGTTSHSTGDRNLTTRTFVLSCRTQTPSDQEKQHLGSEVITPLHNTLDFAVFPRDRDCNITSFRGNHVKTSDSSQKVHKTMYLMMKPEMVACQAEQ
jgi:hypothetical protein